MSKAYTFDMDDSNDSGFITEKDNDEANTSYESPASKDFSLKRQQNSKINFKSLTTLNAKDSIENLQKIRRRNDNSRRIFLNKSFNNGEKRNRKKCRKRYDKSNVSEVSIRKVTEKLNRNEKLVNVVNPRKLGKSKKGFDEFVRRNMKSEFDENGNIKIQIPNEITDVTEINLKKVNSQTDLSMDNPGEILQSFEKLKLVENSMSINSPQKQNAQNLDEAKSLIDYSSGDVRQNFSLDLDLGLSDESFSDMACAQIFDSKRRSVQWKREVDVIYYAGDADGGKVVRRENEPLREEAEQQARRNRFIQLALTKNLLSNMSACQLRDPWLVVLPK